jgi:hypothetical protein
LSVSRRLASRLRYVVKRGGKETKENNFSIHKNLQNIRKKYKNKNPYGSKKKSKKSIYKEKHRKMLQLMRKRAERRKKMKNSEKKIVKEDGENKHV